VPTRAVIVDDDELWREKMAVLLGTRDDLVVTATATHEVAVRWTEEWTGVDVVVVDAGDVRRQDDQFPGVGVVREARHRCSAGARIVVVTGHFLDDALRWRMREAGADYFYHRSDVQDPDALYDAVVHPDRVRAGVPDIQDPEAAYRVGVVGGSDRHGSPRSRQWSQLRRQFNQAARLNTVNADGTVPNRDQVTPSYDQIGRFYRWATRAKHP
jgi:CheY-like chemotaxis protein